MPEQPQTPQFQQNTRFPQVRDLRQKIRGLLPENMQARVLAAIALLMTLIILFSSHKSPHDVKAPAPQTPPAVDPSPPRIQEYRVGIEAATRQLEQEEAQLAKTKAVLASRTEAATTANSSPSQLPKTSIPSAYAARELGYYSSSERSLPSGDRTLFASNIALTYRPAPGTPSHTVAEQPTAASESVTVPSGFLPKEHPGLYRLLEGTALETVLTNRLDSSFSGPVNCLVTTDAYSLDHSAILIPQGSRVLGEVRKLESLGEQRLAVCFHRLIRPDGYSASLDKFQGLNQIGETGLRDKVNHHYLQIFGASLAIGAVAGLAQANTRYGINETATDAYEQGVTSSLSQSAIHVLDRYLNVLPTFTIREGHRIKVYLSQDLELPAYDPHRDF